MEVEDSWLGRMRHRWEDFEQFVVDVIYDRRKGVKEGFLSTCLIPFSWIFNAGVRVRRYLYQAHVIKNHPLGCLVVVVGNLTVGGTGKTPIVEKLAKTLSEKGRKVAILSRGYKSKNPKSYKRLWWWMTHKEAPPPKIVSDGKHLCLNSEESGDEPYMLARNLPGVIVLVDKDRVKAGQYAIKKFGVDTLILDDGFQYLPLRGRLNLLLIDKTNPFGNGFLLPRGILREPVDHLKWASHIFLTKSNGEFDYELEKKIRQYKPEAEIIECKHGPKYLECFETGRRYPLEMLKNAKVGVFSGIATPEIFESLLGDLGAKLVYKRRFLDHHRFDPYDLEEIFENAKAHAAEIVMTTEKDAVRLASNYKPSLPLYYLRLEIELLKGGVDFEDVVSRICFPRKSMKATRFVS